MAKDKEGFEALIPFFMPEKANMAIRMRVSANGEVYISKKIIDSVRKENENMYHLKIRFLRGEYLWLLTALSFPVSHGN